MSISTTTLCIEGRYAVSQIYSYAECQCALRRYAECHYAECHYAECHYAECHYTVCRYTECFYAKCSGSLNKI